MGGDAMNGPPKLGGRSSKVASVGRLEGKKKPSARNPLAELNSDSAEASRGGCFRFLLPDSSAKASLGGSKPVLRTPPRSAPQKQRNAANPSRLRTFQKNASKSNDEVPKQLGSGRPSKPRASDLLQRWNKRKPCSNDKDCGPKLDLVGRSLVGSCLLSSPKRSHPGFDARADAKAEKEAEERSTTTPTSATTPPVEASISPEVPAEVPSAAAPPVCFATGHLIAGVHDRRKCRPRGMLIIGESDLEMEKVPHGGMDRSPASATPPLAGASIRWVSSPWRNTNSGVGSNSGSGSRCAAEPSADWLLPPCEYGEDAPKGEFLMGIRTTPDHEFWSFSPSGSSKGKSPHRGLLSLNSPGLKTTLSSGVGVQRTPTTGGSVSPFSLIMEKIAKTSKSKHVRAQQGRGGNRYGSALDNSPFSDSSLVEGLATPPSHSNSKRRYNVSEIKMDSIQEVLENISLSPNPQRNDANFQAALPGLSFQFGCLATPSNSVDLNHFRNPSCERISVLDDVSVQEKVLPSSETRISWREGLVSRIFEMGEFDCCQWLSDDEGNSSHHEEEGIRSIPDLMFDKEKSGFTPNSENEHIAAAGFGSVELVFEAENIEAKVPIQGPINCAESMSVEGILLDSSDDSDWTLFYKNHLFEV